MNNTCKLMKGTCTRTSILYIAINTYDIVHILCIREIQNGNMYSLHSRLYIHVSAAFPPPIQLHIEKSGYPLRVKCFCEAMFC